MDQLCGWIQEKTGIAISLTNEGLLTPVLLSIGSGISYMLSMVLIPPLLKKMDKKTLWIWMSFIGAIADIITFIIGVWVVPYNTVPGVIPFTLCSDSLQTSLLV